MRRWLARFQPTPWLARKLVMLAALIAVGVSAFCWGRWQVAANPPSGRNSPFDGPLANVGDSDYARRVVAYLYGNVAISREELGEYLIARFGADRLDFLVNRKIVETEAHKYNIYVTDAEIEERFQRDLKSFGAPMDEKTFVNNILRRFGKTLYEWKEDVIRPKLMMEKIVRPMVRQSLTEKDLMEGFEARFGPKVECRMIVLEKGDGRIAQRIYEEARKSKDAFFEQARKQQIPNLANTAGQVPPIHKHFGDARLEECAFRLKQDEIGPLMQLQDGTWVVLMCEKHIPAVASVRFENERAKLMLDMEELRLAQRIPEVFAKMREQADPKLLLVPGRQTGMLQGTPTALARNTEVNPNMPPPPKVGEVVAPKDQPTPPVANDKVNGVPEIKAKAPALPALSLPGGALTLPPATNPTPVTPPKTAPATGSGSVTPPTTAPMNNPGLGQVAPLALPPSTGAAPAIAPPVAAPPVATTPAPQK